MRNETPRRVGAGSVLPVVLLFAASVRSQPPVKKPAGQLPGAGKVLGLPTPKNDKDRRAKALVLPPRVRKPEQGRSTKPQKPGPVVTGDGAMVDFVNSLLSKKALTTAELVAEYSLLAPSERLALNQRAHRLPSKAIGRLARVYRALPDPTGATPLLTVLRSRKLGHETRDVVDNLLFLSGERAKMVGLDLLTSRYHGVRQAAAKALIGILDRVDLPQLLLLIDHKDQGTRLTALHTLAGWLDLHPGEELDPLVRCLRHRDGAVRAAAARALRGAGDRVLKALQAMVAGDPHSQGYFLAAILVAQRELVQGKDLLPKGCLSQLARQRFGVDPMRRSVAFVTAALRYFRDPKAFREHSGALAAVRVDELLEELLGIAEVKTFYPEFPVCHDAALLALRLLTGEDFAADHRRWKAWWDRAKDGFLPFQRSMKLDIETAARTRIGFVRGDKSEFYVLGSAAAEPDLERGGFRCRIEPARFLALFEQLEELGLLDLDARLREAGKFTEPYAFVIEGPVGRARDAFVNAKSVRLRMFQNVFGKLLEQEAWQELVPADLDLEARRNWWIGQTRALKQLPDDAARAHHVLTLALDAMGTLAKDARRRAIGRFLEVAGKDPGSIDAEQTRRLLRLTDSRKLETGERDSIFEVLAAVPNDHFDDVLAKLATLPPQHLWQVLRRMLAIAGPERAIQAMRHEAVSVRAAATAEAGRAGGPKAIPVLLERLGDKAWEVRLRAVESCGRLRLEAGRSKIETILANDESRPVRRAAMLAIARIGGPAAYPILLRAAGPGDAVDRLAAVRGLTMLADPRAGHALVQIASAHIDSALGILAMRGLRNRGGAALERLVMAHLQAADNPKLRRELILLLGEMGDISIAKQLLEMLEGGVMAERCCRLLAGIAGQDWCTKKDRVKRYRDWLLANLDKTRGQRLVDALRATQIKSPLRVVDLVPAAKTPVVDELCRLVEAVDQRHWPIRSLAARILRDVTSRDFGSVHRTTGLGARQAIAERYREYARARDADR